VVVLLRCIPFLEHGRVTGAIVLLRDVSDLRRRDRLLVSKDATIREIHHRVKNNLQTISSLLRLHGRRLGSDEARAAIEESVRRIRSIALVHETLSAGASQEVDLGDIVRQLVRMVGEGIGSDEHPVRLIVEGDPGEVRAEVATPLAVVLTELLQNALEHAFPRSAFADRTEPAKVVVSLSNDTTQLLVRVADNGCGLPKGFGLDGSTLGLTIVRALVTTDLNGIIAMDSDGGTVVEIRVPVEPSATAL
jgi:two-component system, sensor histidine kinase PdtaS